MQLTLSPIRLQMASATFLALIAGYLDGYGLLCTGHLCLFHERKYDCGWPENWTAQFQCRLAVCDCRFVLCNWQLPRNLLSESKLRYCHRLIFGTIAFLLAIVVALELCGVRSSNTRIGTLSLAMGMMNPALSKIGAESVSLTFVTGTLSRIGVHLASAAVRKPLVLDEGRADSHLARARIDAIIWAGFLLAQHCPEWVVHISVCGPCCPPAW
jgi:uncharacterized membrane protein YoaK (UPF0700 family)